jgi:hypothetical protein
MRDTTREERSGGLRWGTVALPGASERWSLTSLREKVVKIGAKVVAHGRYIVFQMAKMAVPQELFGRILDRIARRRARCPLRCKTCGAALLRSPDCGVYRRQPARRSAREGQLRWLSICGLF